MALTRFESRLSRIYDAPRELVWALVSDTNRSDRALGLAAAKYRWVLDESTGEQTRVASASELGFPMEWVEPPYQWVEGRFVRGRRAYIKGPVSEGYFEATLTDEPGGKTKLEALAGMATETFVGKLGGPVQRAKFKRKLTQYLDSVGSVLEGWRERDVLGADQPSAVRVRHLLAVSHDTVAIGPSTPTDAALLEHRGRQLRASPARKAIVTRLLDHIRARPDDEVTQMRPFELAELWGEDRRDVLRAFLHATLAGVTDLRWQINCPVCRVGASVVEDLASLTDTSHCAACQIGYDTDFAKHVEAVFPVNPAIRAVEPQLYCASSPAFLPHVMAQVRVPAGERRELPVDLRASELHVRTLGERGGVDVEVGGQRKGLSIELGDELRAIAADEPYLVVENLSESERVVLVERAGWSADAVLGTVICSFPEFLNLFATEAPASGVELKVSHIALLFSDLVGSTALYERVGDARAYAIVENHFRLMERAIGDAGGAIVKTMGDAVMGTFPGPQQAMAAARAMIEVHDAEHPDGDLGVKVGVHSGACLAVRANDRLDFFGTVVNMAARLQGVAAASEIVMTRETYEDPTVAPLAEGLPIRAFKKSLKGIESEQDLVAVIV